MYEQLMDFLMRSVTEHWLEGFILPIKVVTAKMRPDLSGMNVTQTQEEIAKEAGQLLDRILAAQAKAYSTSAQSSFNQISLIIGHTPYSGSATTSNSNTAVSSKSTVSGKHSNDDEEKAVTSHTEISPVSIQESFKANLRGETGKFARAIRIGTAKELYEEALIFAEIAYDALAEKTSNTIYESIKAAYPLPTGKEIEDPGTVERIYQEILNDERILASESDIEDHLVGHSHLQGQERDAYIKERHQRARQKIAGSWATMANNVVTMKELSATESSSGLAQQIKKRTEETRGRDVLGRLSYFLMNVNPCDMAKFLLGEVINQGEGALTGIAKLGFSVGGAFSDAACHNDARKMTDLLSGGQHVKGERKVNNGNLKETIVEITEGVQQCPGSMKVLKLTNFMNHSKAYLIDSKSGLAVLYETMAGQDSQTIMFNDLIENQKTLPVEAAIASVKEIASNDGGDVVWEIHKAASMETVKARTEKQLRNGATSLALCLAISADEQKEGYVEASGRGKEAMDRYKSFTLPMALLDETEQEDGPTNIGPISIFHLTGLEPAKPLECGCIYRMSALGKWFKVEVVKACGDEAPAWMGKALDVKILEIGGGYANPQLREPVGGETLTSMQYFVFQIAKVIPLRAQLFKPTSADYEKQYGDYVIVEDPFWKDGGPDRKILYRKK